MRSKLLMALATFIVIGCSNEEPENRLPQEVVVNFDYNFWESGSMTKAGADLYSDFYNKYIKTKLLTPTSYSLTLGTKDTPKATTMEGYWDTKDGVRLLEGIYNVKGFSAPKHTNQYIDSLALSFNEKVTITKETTSIKLTANYTSYMLIFDAANTQSIEYCGYMNGIYQTYSLKKVDNIFYAFIHREAESNDKIVITRKNKSVITINPYGLSFEKGKYYYFNDTTNSFNIPSMEGGN